ncbi:bifunctional methylenetetrahydrofolate dehydrogenase/methenyltetrahydrofolate cyclohydrolase FolD [Herbiconiux sp. A18JL235]|uniref:Bifunctional protein FolD n=1 Tax=Herbiconiux sp. A18JL235 TaxID=3152363 RepID=A0AB39BJ09_9MICO
MLTQSFIFEKGQVDEGETGVEKMMAEILDGAAVARRVREEVARRVAALRQSADRVPGLATVLVGDDPASEVYVATKRRMSLAVGMAEFHRHLPASSSQHDVAETIRNFARNDAVSGILLQLPLPRHLNAAALISEIPPHKDVDGLTEVNAGRLLLAEPGLRPCTPLGVMELLDSCATPLSGALCAVIGRSNLVGKPVAQMLLQRDATVVMTHSRTRDLRELTRAADVVVAAAGVPGLLTGDAVKEGAAVIDVGIHRTPKGLIGDVDFATVATRAGRITPVPGGVGPMTIAMLLRNTMLAAEGGVR